MKKNKILLNYTHKYILSIIRISIISIIGLTQLFLVMFGCLYVRKTFQEVYPFLKYLRGIEVGIGFITLMYPMYILMAMEKVEKRLKNNKKQ